MIDGRCSMTAAPNASQPQLAKPENDSVVTTYGVATAENGGAIRISPSG